MKDTFLRTFAAIAANAALASVLFRLIGEWYNVGLYRDALHISLSQLKLSAWESAVGGAVSAWLAGVVAMIVLAVWLPIAYLWGVNVVNMAARPLQQRVGYATFALILEMGALAGLYWMFRVPFRFTWRTWIGCGVVLALCALAPWLVSVPSSILKPNRRGYLIPFVKFAVPTLLLFGLFSSISWFIGPMAQRAGALAGCISVTTARELFRFTAETPLLPDVPFVRQRYSEQDVFEYDGFYLLLHNEGKYFLYRQLDAEHRPTEVFVVKDADLLGSSTRLEQMTTNINPPCDKVIQ